MATATGRVATVAVMVTPEIWARLQARKMPGESFNEVITSLLDDADEALAEDTR